MKKNLLTLFYCALFSLAACASAVEIIIHDDGPNGPNDPYGPGPIKDRAECLYVIEAEDGTTTGTVGYFGQKPNNQHLYLLSNGASVTVTCAEPTDVIYIQSSGSDDNDGTADYYVDGVLVTSINTWMRGNWYLEIRGLEKTAHTVTVVANPPDINLDYFCFGDRTLLNIDIVGPNSAAEESLTQYQVIGYYDNDSNKNVTADANLMVVPDEFAQIDANGLLATTYRLYSLQEICTIYADYQGFTAEKQIRIYPLCDGNECTKQQLLERNISDVIEIKQDIAEDLTYAMKIEQVSLGMLAQMMSKDKHFKCWQPDPFSKARMRILAALMWECWANSGINISIDSLEDALKILQTEKPGKGK